MRAASWRKSKQGARAEPELNRSWPRLNMSMARLQPALLLQQVVRPVLVAVIVQGIHFDVPGRLKDQGNGVEWHSMIANRRSIYILGLDY